MSDVVLEAQVKRLLASIGWGALHALEPLHGGANNRVFRAVGEGGQALVKSYCRHPGDPRDRLATEIAFARFARSQGLQTVPQLLGVDADAGLGIFEFVAGRALLPTEVNRDAVSQALDFFRSLNQARFHPAAARLSAASEACFSLAAHLACVDRRIRLLLEMPCTVALEVEVLQLIEQEVAPTWSRVKADVLREAARQQQCMNLELTAAERILSPSDFGFHNALREASGRLRFLDFEYAGWDDVSKLIGDFFCQPARPVPLNMFDEFVANATAFLPHPAEQAARARLLLPVYRVKWLCILLDEFLPAGKGRRLFAQGTDSWYGRQRQQLDKAVVALRELRASLCARVHVA